MDSSAWPPFDAELDEFAFDRVGFLLRFGRCDSHLNGEST
jgi:hypothetical protein